VLVRAVNLFGQAYDVPARLFIILLLSPAAHKEIAVWRRIFLVMQVDWERLWQQIMDGFALDVGSLHGPAHWRRVERYGVQLATQHEGDVLVARLFAVFHDACRRSDHRDDDHGARGAALAARLRGEYFNLSDAGFAQLHYACCWHTAGQLSPDPTIGACWDADRLDLWRAGITPHERFMSTAGARDAARTGRTGPAHLP
jgi:uncharacterized protein